MNLSLRYRVTLSFIIANLVVLILSFTVFHYLNSLRSEIEGITSHSNKITLLSDQIRISSVAVIKNIRKVLTQKATAKDIESTIGLIDSFASQLDDLESLYNDSEVKKFVVEMKTHIDYLKLVLSKAAQFQIRGGEDALGLSDVEVLSDKILETFANFQDIQYYQSVKRNESFEKVINETKRNMMITLIIGFLGTIILGLVVPGKIALPFKKIKDAIRELQDCNFDVNIYYSQEDEIGDIAREMNKMIHNFKIFEELRQDRVGVENRKFDALANMVKRPVLVANANGKLIYMNNQLYSLLQVQSEDVIGKDMRETVIPHTIIDSYQLAIRRRSKIENAEVFIPLRKSESEGDEADILAQAQVEEAEAIRAVTHQKIIDGDKEVEVVYKGYANIIPIRGRESSLDYYLMVLSKEVFV